MPKEISQKKHKVDIILCAAGSLWLAVVLILFIADGSIGVVDGIVTAAIVGVLTAASMVMKRKYLIFIAEAAVSYAAIQMLTFSEFSWNSEAGVLLHVFGALWVLMVYLLLYAITGNIFATSCLCAVAAVVYGLVNYFMMLYRGRQFLAIDILAARTGLNVISGYSLELSGKAWIICSGIAAQLLPAFAISREQQKLSRRERTWTRLSCVAIPAIYVYVCIWTNIYYDLGLKMSWNDNTMDESAVMYFVDTTKRLQVIAPSGYSDEELDAIDESIENDTGDSSSDVQPNIIAIMSESFADLSIAGDFETSSDVLSNFYSVQSDSVVYGYTVSSVFGGGTANSEFEFLTSNSMAFVPEGSNPYQQYFDYSKESLVSVLEEQGYSTHAMHPYYSSGWNRPEVYEALGFDTTMFIEDFGNVSYYRGLPDDESNFENLIEKYEEYTESESGPVFIFDITMQNHGGYHTTNFDPTVTLTGMEGEYTQAEEYLSCLEKSDEALELLISYFEEQDEPVIILFFGDHWPQLSDGFYEYLFGSSISSLEGEDLVTAHMSPFFIWTNYDTGTEAEDVGTVSINYLASILLDTADLEESDFQYFLGTIMESYPIIYSGGIIDSSGVMYDADDSSFTYDTAIGKYKILEYNYLFDPQGYRKDIFGLKS
ncbi:MAG: LTA synthase family protein [Oscillospiraceae bacterium]